MHTVISPLKLWIAGAGADHGLFVLLSFLVVRGVCFLAIINDYKFCTCFFVIVNDYKFCTCFFAIVNDHKFCTCFFVIVNDHTKICNHFIQL